MGRVPYTEDEQKFMLANAGKLSLQEIADKLGRTEKSVRSYFNKRKIATRKDTYTDQEIQYIIDNAGKYSWEHIAKELGKSPDALRTFVSRRKIKGSYLPENKSAHDPVVKCQGLMCCNYFRGRRQNTKFCSARCDRSNSNIERYGISVQDWQRMYVNQKAECICGEKFDYLTKMPGVDHNHACCASQGRSCGNCVRSLLCNQCNMALGLLKDNPERLELLADYLRRHSIN